ncbi:MAG: aminopeptidase P family protein [Rhodobacteraceae bacterium]|nr:aminopeptidase P family protein [Paracoccaceae bacterium]
MSDFARSEFVARLACVQTLMGEQDLDAILLTTEAEVRYFSGFRTQFWQSPTRPWFLILPREGEPIAVIPGIGAELMGTTWVKDIRTWSSPHPTDEGVGLLLEALGGSNRVGLPMGEEASLRMPLRDFNWLQSQIHGVFVDCSELIKSVRMVKSAAEIGILRRICTIGSDAFDRVPELAGAGVPLSEVFRRFKIALLEAGAEDVPYLVGAAATGGYGDVISPPSADPLQPGDVLMLDTGATLQGYFCDFDRNFAIHRADAAARDAHTKLWDATEAGMAAARPGATCSDLFNAMNRQLGGGSDVGRFGHGLGLQLTEWPSIASHDVTVMQPGMVMTLEPSIVIGPEKIMVHEENILITEGAPELLTRRAAQELPVIG